MSSSELSTPLSTPPQSEDEMPDFNLDGAPRAVKSKAARSDSESVKTTPKRKRAPSPPHEEVLADNPDIAFIVMFRSRFNDAFPPKLIQFSPQDIERGVVDQTPSPQVEALLCALLGLVLNRKKPVERGHHGRALEDSIHSNKAQWPRAWNGQNPLSGSRSFNTMNPQERLILLKSLILWALNTSETIGNMIKESYKQSRHDDDLNQPLSVQPWGRDGDKRRYWLIEGRDDTPFRLYRESNPALKRHTWWSVAGSVEELKTVAQKLADDGTQAARRLSARINNAIPRFEASEEKIRRREYRLARKAQFARPEPGFSLYEGRTRGKRMKYTFSEDEDELADSDVGPRRSTRAAAQAAVAEQSGPTVTASGRTVRNRVGGLYGETLHSGQTTSRASPMTNDYIRSEGSEEPWLAHGRSTRSGGRGTLNGWVKPRKHIDGYNSVDEMDDEEDAESSGAEWEGGDEEEPDDVADDDLSDDLDEESKGDTLPKSLVVKLRYPKVLAERVSAVLQKELTATSSAARPLTPTLKSEPANLPAASSIGTDVKPAPTAPELSTYQSVQAPPSVAPPPPAFAATAPTQPPTNGTADPAYPTPTATTAIASPAQYSLPYSPQKPVVAAAPAQSPSAPAVLPPSPFAPRMAQAQQPKSAQDGDIEMADGPKREDQKTPLLAFPQVGSSM